MAREIKFRAWDGDGSCIEMSQNGNRNLFEVIGNIYENPELLK